MWGVISSFLQVLQMTHGRAALWEACIGLHRPSWAACSRSPRGPCLARIACSSLGMIWEAGGWG